MEKSGLMPVECVMASCNNVIWRAYRAPAVVLNKKINVSSHWKSDILVAASVCPCAAQHCHPQRTVPRDTETSVFVVQRQARATRSVTQGAPGVGAPDRAMPEVPKHPSFQEYCRVCMTKIRAVEQQMRESVEAKDLEQLDLAIEIGNAINVVRICRCSCW